MAALGVSAGHGLGAGTPSPARVPDSPAPLSPPRAAANPTPPRAAIPSPRQVPTTRALSLVTTGDSVMRDMFYNGDAKFEPGAVVCRVAPSFVRWARASRADHQGAPPAVDGGPVLGTVAAVSTHVLPDAKRGMSCTCAPAFKRHKRTMTPKRAGLARSTAPAPVTKWSPCWCARLLIT
jgi:uncharacterized Zn-binding protein involved in type VI secretion